MLGGFHGQPAPSSPCLHCPVFLPPPPQTNHLQTLQFFLTNQTPHFNTLESILTLDYIPPPRLFSPFSQLRDQRPSLALSL